MAEDKKTKEAVQPEITIEQLQAANETLNTKVVELETENAALLDEIKKLKEVRTAQHAKITELTEVKTDSKSLRTENKKGEVKVKFILSPAGKFMLPYNVGQVVLLPANQADEIVEMKYAEYVK